MARGAMGLTLIDLGSKFVGPFVSAAEMFGSIELYELELRRKLEVHDEPAGASDAMRSVYPSSAFVWVVVPGSAIAATRSSKTGTTRSFMSSITFPWRRSAEIHK